MRLTFVASKGDCRSTRRESELKGCLKYSPQQELCFSDFHPILFKSLPATFRIGFENKPCRFR